jgi:polyisoprenyl-phosphate glycosyltransferase
MGSLQKKIGIVTPCFNEEAGIAECYERVRAVMADLLPEYRYEHLFIDNCSTDGTVSILREIAATDKRVKVIVNSRNFGLGRSPFHGLMMADGDAVVPIFADLQTPPELIVQMVAKWQEGYKIVAAVRREVQQSWRNKVMRALFYKLFARISNVQYIPNYFGFGLYDRKIMEVIRSLNEPDPYFRGLISEIGFEKCLIEYVEPPRKHGTTRHRFFDLLDLAILGITTYSRVPLRLLTIVAVIVASLSFLAGTVYLILKLVFWSSFSVGIAPLLIGALFLSAVQMLAIGLVGEYIGLVLLYSRRFPPVIEQERINFD